MDPFASSSYEVRTSGCCNPEGLYIGWVRYESNSPYSCGEGGIQPWNSYTHTHTSREIPLDSRNLQGHSPRVAAVVLMAAVVQSQAWFWR